MNRTATRPYTIKGKKRIVCPKCGKLGVLKTHDFTFGGGKIVSEVIHTHHMENLGGWWLSIVDTKCQLDDTDNDMLPERRYY